MLQPPQYLVHVPLGLLLLFQTNLLQRSADFIHVMTSLIHHVQDRGSIAPTISLQAGQIWNDTYTCTFLGPQSAKTFFPLLSINSSFNYWTYDTPSHLLVISIPALWLHPNDLPHNLPFHAVNKGPQSSRPHFLCNPRRTLLISSTLF